METKNSRKDRPRPSAYHVLGAAKIYPDRVIVLSTGRGDTRLTPAEARELAADLVFAANSAEGGLPTETAQ